MGQTEMWAWARHRMAVMRSLISFGLATSLLVCLGLSHARGDATVVAASKSAGHDSGRSKAIHHVLLRSIVETRCQVLLCLLSIGRKPVGQEELQGLGSLGRVSTPTADDFVFEDGAVRGFSKRQAQIIDIESVAVRKSEATARVAYLTTGLGSTVCTYRLRESSGKWEVDQVATRCTL
jgi:hypothetical protein